MLPLAPCSFLHVRAVHIMFRVAVTSFSLWAIKRLSQWSSVLTRDRSLGWIAAKKIHTTWNLSGNKQKLTVEALVLHFLEEGLPNFLHQILGYCLHRHPLHKTWQTRISTVIDGSGSSGFKVRLGNLLSIWPEGYKMSKKIILKNIKIFVIITLNFYFFFDTSE